MTVRGMLPALIATTQLVGCAGLEPAADSGVGGLREAAREVEALERAYHLALAVGDRARQEQLLAEDYLFVTPIGEVLDREATMNDLRAFEFVSRVDDLQLRVSDSGDTVVLTMKATGGTVHHTDKNILTRK